MTHLRDFTLARTPKLHFGPGKVSVLSGEVKTFGPKALLVHGARSFPGSSNFEKLLKAFQEQGTQLERCTIEKEPTPAMIDEAVRQSLRFAPDCVVAIGGGSVLDAGKAISAMLVSGEPVKEFLEGVGTRQHPGTKVPFIAVPTTSGTGSEATKNAVISEIGANGFKRSLRHDNFVPDLAILDPDLTLSCPKNVTASSGMDAFTQLLESYLSTSANPFTSSLALEGLARISQSLLRAWENGEDRNARAEMSLAAYLSGITLANAGLGVVHGLAAPLGALFDIPHGVICSALMAPANRITVQLLRSRDEGKEALNRYATVGRLFAGHENRPADYYVDFLINTIHSWTSTMRIPHLSTFGVTAELFPKIMAAADSKNNPVRLTEAEMSEVLRMAL